MKAWTIGNPATISSMRLQDIDVLEPGPGQVLVRWRATSLNFHDYLVCTGVLPAHDGRIPLSDGAGEIAGIGPGVEAWKVGDRVISLFFPNWVDGEPSAAKVAIMTGDTTDGCAAEYSVVRSDALTAMPADYSFAEAATLPCAALTAWRALVPICGVSPGDTVMVQGTGGMSLACLQIAKMAGAKVFATSSSEEKLERVRALGADVTINYRADPEWGRTAFDLAGGGIDHIIDAGGAATLEQSMAAARTGANIVLVGVLGGIEAQLNLKDAFARQLHLEAIAVGSKRMQEQMIAALELSAFRPVLDSVRPFAELPAAFEHLESGRHFGKIIVTND